MVKIIDRINQLIEYKRISTRAFEQSIGASNGMISRAILKKTDISASWLSIIIEKYPDVSSKWLLTGKSNMIVINNNIGESENAAAKCSSKNAVAKYEMQQQNAVTILKEPSVEYRRLKDTQNAIYKANEADETKGIPLIPITAIAGPGAVVFSDLVIEQYYIIPELKNAEFMIRMKGNSMYPRYSSGDVLACTKVLNIKFFQWNKVYAIYTESQGIMIKRIHEGTNVDTIKLLSDNPEYPPFEIPRTEIQSVALVIGCVRCE